MILENLFLIPIEVGGERLESKQLSSVREVLEESQTSELRVSQTSEEFGSKRFVDLRSLNEERFNGIYCVYYLMGRQWDKVYQPLVKYLDDLRASEEDWKSKYGGEEPVVGCDWQTQYSVISWILQKKAILYQRLAQVSYERSLFKESDDYLFEAFNTWKEEHGFRQKNSDSKFVEYSQKFLQLKKLQLASYQVNTRMRLGEPKTSVTISLQILDEMKQIGHRIEDHMDFFNFMSELDAQIFDLFMQSRFSIDIGREFHFQCDLEGLEISHQYVLKVYNERFFLDIINLTQFNDKALKMYFENNQEEVNMSQIQVKNLKQSIFEDSFLVGTMQLVKQNSG